MSGGADFMRRAAGGGHLDDGDTGRCRNGGEAARRLISPPRLAAVQAQGGAGHMFLAEQRVKSQQQVEVDLAQFIHGVNGFIRLQGRSPLTAVMRAIVIQDLF